MDIHIIHTKSAMILSKKSYASWRRIQDEFEDYTTSLDPWSPDQVIEYLGTEYPDLDPPAADQVRALIRGSAEAVELTFDSRRCAP